MCLTENGKDDPISDGLDSRIKVFQLHSETINLRSGITLLAEGEHCKIQMIRVGEKAYGIQGHLELTFGSLKRWLRDDDELKKLDADELDKAYREVKEELKRNGEKIINNFLTIAGLR